MQTNGITFSATGPDRRREWKVIMLTRRRTSFCRVVNTLIYREELGYEVFSSDDLPPEGA